MIFSAVDLYCGAGGTTTGAELSGRVRVKLAINHWTTAIATHQKNHPETKHICAPIDHVDPRAFVSEGIDIILASPECTHHSIARGGRPVEDQKRAGGWDVLKWVEALRPKYLIVENVREWQHWGPVGANGKPLKSKRGEFFKAWVAGLEAANYRVEWRLLNSADFGEATSRTRLFVIARRGRGAITWPVPTHRREDWRGAQEIIDWQKPCPSIFDRKRPLADKTLRRIEIGIRKFCSPDGSRPFIVKLRGTGTVSDIQNPLPTVTAGGKHEALATPFLVPNFGEREGQTPRTHSIHEPLPTVTSHGAGGLAVPFLMDIHNRRRDDNTTDIQNPVPTIVTKPGNSLVMPFILPHRGFHCHRTPLKPEPRSVRDPLPTIVGSPTSRHYLAMPFLTKYFGTADARPVTEPLSTVTTKARHGLAMVKLIAAMGELRIADIGFRMLDTDELLQAQGFPAGYSLHGNKAEQTKQIGNSVCVRVAKAICEALAA